MSTKSAIDQFAASIVLRISFYLTACLGLLLSIAILFRQFDNVGGAGLTLLDEFLTLLVTLGFAYAAIWLAGFLAIVSTKRKLLRSEKPKSNRGDPADSRNEFTNAAIEVAQSAPQGSSAGTDATGDQGNSLRPDKAW